MSFFWQSHPNLSNSNGLETRINDLESLAISSPLRRIHQSDFKNFLTLSPNPEVRSRFPRVEDIAPLEIISFQNNQSDYICGVRKKGRTCTNNIYCQKHSFCERIKVCRSRPLQELMKSESKNQRVFAKRRELAKSIQNCKSYWTEEENPNDKNKTCTHTSCSNSDYESGKTSPVLTANSEEEEDLGWKATLLKGSLLKKIAKRSGTNFQDFLSYLHYKLECYEILDVDIRVRELETRFDPLYARLL